MQFGYFNDQIQRKILEWNEEFSVGEKEVLLKTVIQVIPTYAMQCFKWLESIWDDINKMSVGFWWAEKTTLGKEEDVYVERLWRHGHY